MLYICVRGVMDVVFSVCIVTHGAVGVVYGMNECLVMQMEYVGDYGDYVSKLPYVLYYVGVNSSFQHAREECESRRAYVF